MSRRTHRRLWTVTYPDAQDLAGLGVAHFDSAAEAETFAGSYTGASVREELVPARIADRWVITRIGGGR